MTNRAIGIGAALGLEQAVSPTLNVLRSLPPVATISLIIVYAGIGNFAKVFAISLAVFLTMWIGAHVGSREVPQAFLWSARSMGERGSSLLWRVVLPAAAPYVLASARTCVAVAFVMVYVSELAGASEGLGFTISISQLAYRVDRMMAALLLLGLCGAASDFLVTRTAWCVFPWLKLSAHK